MVTNTPLGTLTSHHPQSGKSGTGVSRLQNGHAHWGVGGHLGACIARKKGENFGFLPARP